MSAPLPNALRARFQRYIEYPFGLTVPPSPASRCPLPIMDTITHSIGQAEQSDRTDANEAPEYEIQTRKLSL